MTLKQGGIFVEYTDSYGNPLIRLNRDGSVNLQSLAFSDGSSTTTAGNATELQTQPISATPPVNGQALLFDGTQWYAGAGGTLPTGVAKGSALVSAGVSSTPVFQSKPVLDFRDLGVTLAGDQASAMTTAWNAATKNTAALPAGTLTIASSISPSSTGSYRYYGSGFSGGFGSGTTLSWTGGAAAVLNLDRQRDASVGGFAIDLRSVSGAIGIAVTQLNATSGQISSHNFYHDISISGISTNAMGIALNPPGDSVTDNEAHVLWRLSAIGNSTGSVGIYLGPNSNARCIAAYESETNSTETGLSVNSGSSHVLGALTENHTVAVQWSGGLSTLAWIHDESSKQGINASGGLICGVMLNNSFEVDNPDLTKYFWDFSGIERLVSIGNTMKANANVTKQVKLSGGVGGSWISIGDSLANSTVANLPNLTTTGASGHVMIGTKNCFGSNVAIVGAGGIFAPQPGGLWIAGTTNSPISGGAYDSPILTLSYMSTLNGPASNSIVPYSFQVKAPSLNVSTFTLLPPTDPITGLTWSHPLNFDFATNSNNGNFAVSNIQVTSHAPANAASAGVTGTITWDADFLYVCTSTNVWKRIGIATW